MTDSTSLLANAWRQVVYSHVLGGQDALNFMYTVRLDPELRRILRVAVAKTFKLRVVYNCRSWMSTRADWIISDAITFLRCRMSDWTLHWRGVAVERASAEPFGYAESLIDTCGFHGLIHSTIVQINNFNCDTDRFLRALVGYRYRDMPRPWATYASYLRSASVRAHPEPFDSWFFALIHSVIGDLVVLPKEHMMSYWLTQYGVCDCTWSLLLVGALTKLSYTVEDGSIIMSNGRRLYHVHEDCTGCFFIGWRRPHQMNKMQITCLRRLVSTTCFSGEPVPYKNIDIPGPMHPDCNDRDFQLSMQFPLLTYRMAVALRL